MYNFLVDSHCHLKSLRDEKELNLSKVIEDANNNNVAIINNIATEISEFDDVISIANSFKNVYASIGIHPSNITDEINVLNILKEYAKKEKVIGIGESGLEYFYEPVDKIKQRKNFEVHIEVARSEKLPLVIHSRSADEDMIDILKSEMKNGEFSFVLHCFSSGKELCWTGLDLGGYISLSGIVTFKKADDLRNIIKNVPLNRILLETDSPYLAPVPFRGQINEPKYIKNIANYLVDFLKIDFNIIQETTTKSFVTLFNKIKTTME